MMMLSENFELRELKKKIEVGVCPSNTIHYIGHDARLENLYKSIF